MSDWLNGCTHAVLQAQFFSKLPFGDHVIQKSRELSIECWSPKQSNKIWKEIIFSLVTPCGIWCEDKTDKIPRWLLYVCCWIYIRCSPSLHCNRMKWTVRITKEITKSLHWRNTRQFGDLLDNFSRHFFPLAMATKTVAAWSAGTIDFIYWLSIDSEVIAGLCSSSAQLPVQAKNVLFIQNFSAGHPGFHGWVPLGSL